MPEFTNTTAGGTVQPCATGHQEKPKLVKPKAGHVFLVGQTFEVETSPADATVKATGQTVEGRKLGIGTKPGKTELTAEKDGETSDAAECEIVAAEVTEIVVAKTQPIDDATAPEYRRGLGKQKYEHREVAAILIGEKLSVAVTLQAPKDLTAAAQGTLVGEGDGLILKGKVTLQALAAGQKIELESEKPLNTKVAINKLVIRWRFESEMSKASLGGPDTELHVYTTFKPAIENVRGGRAPVRLKHHYEMGCQWAREASKNEGQGADSIAWNVDNMMRHYVHTKDEKGDVWATCYPGGGAPPVNYDDLPNAWKASSGDRGVSSLYYPPLEVKKPYEDYSNFEHNFGWHLLDNPTHTGGRCNQQASLVCDILGLFGIKAHVHYLQRVGLGRRTGRPCRQYFYAAGGSGPWNFHGIVRVELDGGKEWLYDGSFSSPPSRLNGDRTWAEKPGGPFIQKWHDPWTYDDVDAWESVPADDTPTSWQGIQ